MAKKPNPKPETALVNVSYADGSMTSNRKIPADLLTALDSDNEILAYLRAQDRDIAEKSGRPRAEIEDFERVK